MHILVRVSRGCRLFAAVIAAVLATSYFVRAEQSVDEFQWTTNYGGGFQARFVKLEGSSLVVVKDGIQFAVPLLGLSPASQELAGRLAGQLPWPAPAMPVPPIASIDFGPLILAYCQDSIGKKIGDGECAALATEALKSAGAAVRGDEDSSGNGDYVWGELVASIKGGFSGARGVKALAHVEVGDIVQFHDTRFVGHSHMDSGVYRLDAQHHTAIVESVDIAHKTIGVIQQNSNGHKLVHRQTLYLGGMVRGSLRIYHPVPPTEIWAGSWH